MAEVERRRRVRAKSSTKSVTMQDVGRAAGVSAQTVSRALSFPDQVSEETRHRVERAIADTGYLPNLAASSLASNRSRTIAAILPVISTSIFSDTLRAAATRLTPAGYQLIVGYTDYHPEREEDLVRGFIQRRPDGFFIVGTLHTPETLRLLRSYGAPVVETWDWIDDPMDTLVGFSNESATGDLVRHLVARGHRTLIFAGTIGSGDARALRRRDGFARAVGELLPGEPVRIVELPDRDISMDTGVALLDTTLERFPEATAVMFATDVFAVAAILAAQRRGIAVPDRLAITGFGDFEMSRHLNPALTTVSVDIDAIGTRAADLLLARLAGTTVESATVDVGYRIVARESA